MPTASFRVASLAVVVATAACAASAGERGGADSVEGRTGTIDCSSFDIYTAALASATVDCLGTIGPGAYAHDDASGLLRRTFDACPQQDKLQSIDDLLGLQRREQRLPNARACIAGRWAAWGAAFAHSGGGACPMWRKDETIDAPTGAGIHRVMQALAAGEASIGSHENYVFTAFFADGRTRGAACGTPAACAARCAGGLPGFVLAAEGSRVLADPAYWLLDNVFAGSSNPFLCNGYFHPMSYCGPPPGAIVGHRNRAGENCSYFQDEIHYIIPLKLDCLDPADDSSCVTVCAP
jgi:hypothetical protein